MAVSKRTRFEVFKRDSFKCQYCGRSAPDVVLEADHVEPKSKGGKDAIINLVTACRDCNAGKSDKRLDDESALSKERRQLEDLNERREQLEMMLKWKRGMSDIQTDAAQACADRFGELCGCTIKPNGITTLRKLVKKFGVSEVLTAIDIAVDTYSDREKAFSKISGILYIRAREAADPHYAAVCRIKGKLRWKQFYVNDDEVDALVRSVLQSGKADFEEISRLTSASRSYSNWWMRISQLLEGKTES